MKEYYANYTLLLNGTGATPPPMSPADVIRGPCWETAVGIVRQIQTALLFHCVSKAPMLL